MQRKATKDTWSFSQSLIIALEEFVRTTRGRKNLAEDTRFFMSTEEILGEGLGKHGLNNDKEAPCRFVEWLDGSPARQRASRL
jgi:hypothetical protein